MRSSVYTLFVFSSAVLVASTRFIEEAGAIAKIGTQSNSKDCDYDFRGDNVFDNYHKRFRASGIHSEKCTTRNCQPRHSTLHKDQLNSQSLVGERDEGISLLVRRMQDSKKTGGGPKTPGNLPKTVGGSPESDNSQFTAKAQGSHSQGQSSPIGLQTEQSMFEDSSRRLTQEGSSAGSQTPRNQVTQRVDSTTSPDRFFGLKTQDHRTPQGNPSRGEIQSYPLISNDAPGVINRFPNGNMPKAVVHFNNNETPELRAKRDRYVIQHMPGPIRQSQDMGFRLGDHWFKDSSPSPRIEAAWTGSFRKSRSDSSLSTPGMKSPPGPKSPQVLRTSSEPAPETKSSSKLSSKSDKRRSQASNTAKSPLDSKKQSIPFKITQTQRSKSHDASRPISPGSSVDDIYASAQEVRTLGRQQSPSYRRSRTQESKTQVTRPPPKSPRSEGKKQAGQPKNQQAQGKQLKNQQSVRSKSQSSQGTIRPSELVAGQQQLKTPSTSTVVGNPPQPLSKQSGSEQRKKSSSCFGNLCGKPRTRYG